MSFSPTRAYNGRQVMNDRTGHILIKKGSRIDLGSCNVCHAEGYFIVYELDLVDPYGNGMLVRFCPQHIQELKKKLKALP